MISKVRQTALETVVGNLLTPLAARQEQHKERVVGMDAEGTVRTNGRCKALLTESDFGKDGWPKLPSPSQAMVFVHEYVGRDGGVGSGAEHAGYIVYAQAIDSSGRACQKAWDMGPEGRSHPWVEVS